MPFSKEVNEELTVGFVRAPHGLTGEFKIESASGKYEHLLQLKEVTLRNGTSSSKYIVEYINGNSSTFYMKLAGIDSDEKASRLNRCEIRVPRNLACPLKKDEWYVEDLKQCSLIYENKKGLVDMSTPICGKNQIIGKITDVLEGGSGSLLEVSLSESCAILSDNVKLTSSGKPRTVLVPFVQEHVGKVDIKAKTVQLMHLWILE